MKKVILILFLYPVFLTAQTFNFPDTIRYLALGDSYTIGQNVEYNERWSRILYDSLLNRGHQTDTIDFIARTGWRTDDLLLAIDNQKPDSNYTMVSLLIGVNNQFQGKNFSLYEQEFPQLISHAIAFAGGDTANVFVVSIPDYSYTPFGEPSINTGTISGRLKLYNDWAKAYCDSLNIPFFNITPISEEGLQDPDLVASDGLHPSGKQYAKWVDVILQNDLLTITKEDVKTNDFLVEEYVYWEIMSENGRVILSGKGKPKYKLSHGIYIFDGVFKNKKKNSFKFMIY